MNTYPESIRDFELITRLLMSRAEQLGATAFSMRGEFVTNDIAMDRHGPVVWALILHADALSRLSGFSPAYTNLLPFTCVVSEESPYGNEAILQPSLLPISMGLAYLDSALEHAVCLGMRDYDYSPSEWFDLPAEERVIPLEPYFEDLEASWVTDVTAGSATPEQIAQWPQLLNHERLEQQMLASSQGPSAEQGSALPSMR